MTIEEAPIFLSRAEARRALGVSEYALDKLIHGDPDFPAYRDDRRVYIPRRQLEDWIDRQLERRRQAMGIAGGVDG